MSGQPGRPGAWLNAPALIVQAVEPVRGVAEAPGSKSLTNRALAIGALAGGETVVRGPLVSDDTLRMAALVEAIGVTVTRNSGSWELQPVSGGLQATRAEVSVGQSGTAMRFGTALACLVEGALRLSGTPDLHARPIGPLCDALRALGADVRDADGYPPVTVRSNGLRGGRVIVASRASSQFASALLLVAPTANTTSS